MKNTTLILLALSVAAGSAVYFWNRSDAAVERSQSVDPDRSTGVRSQPMPGRLRVASDAAMPPAATSSDDRRTASGVVSGPRVDPAQAFATLRASRFCRNATRSQQPETAQSQSTTDSPSGSAATSPETCRGIEILEPTTEFERLRTLADQGHIEAQLDFVLSASEYGVTPGALAGGGLDAHRYKSDAIRFLESAAGHGSLRALELLSGVYDAGLLAPKDPIRAYAYVFALKEAGRRGYAELLALQEKSLASSQIEAGRQLGAEYHASCCVRNR
jgi:TPR repeat protein